MSQQDFTSNLGCPVSGSSTDVKQQATNEHFLQGCTVCLILANSYVNNVLAKAAC